MAQYISQLMTTVWKEHDNLTFNPHFLVLYELLMFPAKGVCKWRYKNDVLIITDSGMFFQVFDVRLNGHVVVKDLDIFDRVGHSTAHDEIVPFSIRRGKLSVQGEVSTFNGKLTVEFVKVSSNLLNYLRNTCLAIFTHGLHMIGVFGSLCHFMSLKHFF